MLFARHKWWSAPRVIKACSCLVPGQHVKTRFGLTPHSTGRLAAPVNSNVRRLPCRFTCTSHQCRLAKLHNGCGSAGLVCHCLWLSAKYGLCRFLPLACYRDPGAFCHASSRWSRENLSTNQALWSKYLPPSQFWKLDIQRRRRGGAKTRHT